MATWFSVLVGIAVVYAGVVLGLLLAGRRVAARELGLLVPNLVLLFRDLLRDPTVPRGPKIAIGVGLAWLLMPIDLIPEFLPVVGPLDDAIVAALVLRYLVRRAGPDVVRAHWRGASSTVDRILRLAGV